MGWVIAAGSLLLTAVTTAIAVYEWRQRRIERRERAEGRVLRFHIASERERAEFYKATIGVVDKAETEIFKAGRGVSRFANSHDTTVDRYMRAERDAVGRGVRIQRVQLADRVSGEWASKLAQMVEDHPNQYRVFNDFDDRSFLNLSVVDADSDHPIVELLFDTPRPSLDGDKFAASDALIIFDNRPLAQAVRSLFVQRIQLLSELSPRSIRAIGFDHLYFAYGANLDSATMARRAPTAEFVTPAVLDGWELVFGVPGPHLEGGGAAISPRPGAKVWGVIYAVSDDDKRALDLAEEQAYRPISVTAASIPEGGEHAVLAYVPRSPSVVEEAVPPDPEYVARMLSAARSWGLEQLAVELERIQSRAQDC